MSCVRQLFNAELLKIRTARATWVLLGLMAVVLFVIVVLTLSSLDEDELAGADGIRRVLTIGGSIGCFFTLAHGILGMAGEYRHGTLGQALVAAPSRWPAIAAKLLAHAVAGLGFGLVALVVTFIAGVPGLKAQDSSVSLTDSLPFTIMLGTLLAAALFAVIGVGLAALLRDQALALGAGLGWTLLADSLAMGLVPEAGRFLPGGAVMSLLRSQTDDVLPAGFAALLLLAYALAFAAAGIVAVRRRDLT